MELPVYKVDVDNSEGSGIRYVSLVDDPAIKRNWLAFSDEKGILHKFKSVEERVITGPLLIPDFKVYRKDPEHGAHYVIFTREVIKKTALKFFRDQSISNVNLMHEVPVGGVYMFESYFIDKSRGVVTPKGFAELPDGTWMSSYKVDNDMLWQEFIKTGEFKGFSIEGFFKYVTSDPQQEILNNIIKVLNELE